MFIPAYREALRGSVLGPFADAYVGYLQNHQYCELTIRAYLHALNISPAGSRFRTSHAHFCATTTSGGYP